jgi:aspartate aminotransferase
MSDINQLRNRSDEITIEMIKMLKMRTDISKEIGEVKKNI